MVDLSEDIWERYVALSHLLLACSFGYVMLQTSGFYEMVVFYLSNKTCVAVLYNYLFMLFFLGCQGTVYLFLGVLSHMESEQLQDMARNYIMDAILFLVLSKPRLNGQEISVLTLGKYLTLLVALKCFHVLIYVRLSSMFQMDIPSYLSLLRLSSFIYVLSMVDCYMIAKLWNDLTWKNTFTLWVMFELFGMTMVCIFCTLRYMVNMLDYFCESGLKNKTTIFFYLELTHDLISLFCFTLFMAVFYIHNPNHMPAYMLIDILQVVKNLVDRVQMLMHYRKVVKSLETRYPKPTETEKERDGTCIICRDDFDDDSRKIDCGHVFHLSCLKSWLFQHSTCPTCRTPIESNDIQDGDDFEPSRIFLDFERRMRRSWRRLWRRTVNALGGTNANRRPQIDSESLKRLVTTYGSSITESILEKLKNRRVVCEFSVDVSSASESKYDSEVSGKEDNLEEPVVNQQTDVPTSVEEPITESQDLTRTESVDSAPGFVEISAKSILESLAVEYQGESPDPQGDGEPGSVDDQAKPKRRGSMLRSWFRKKFSRSSDDTTRRRRSFRSLFSDFGKSSVDGAATAEEISSAEWGSQSVGSSENRCFVKSLLSKEVGSDNTDELKPETTSISVVEKASNEIAVEATVEVTDNVDTSTVDTGTPDPAPATTDGVSDVADGNTSPHVLKLLLPSWLGECCKDGSDPNVKARCGMFRLVKKLKYLKNKLATLTAAERNALLAAHSPNAIIVEEDHGDGTDSVTAGTTSQTQTTPARDPSESSSNRPASTTPSRDAGPSTPVESSSVSPPSGDTLSRIRSIRIAKLSKDPEEIESSTTDSPAVEPTPEKKEAETVVREPPRGRVRTASEGTTRSVNFSNVNDGSGQRVVSVGSGSEEFTVVVNYVTPSGEGDGSGGSTSSGTRGNTTSMDAVNKLITELQNLEELNCDILVPSDEDLDDEMLSVISSIDLPEYVRDFFLSYCKMVRLWYVAASGLSRSDELCRSMYDCANDRRISSMRSDRQRTMLHDVFLSIKCSVVTQDKLRDFHDKLMRRSVNYQDFLCRLHSSPLPVDLIEHMVTAAALVDSIIDSEFSKLGL
ncbi:ERAD-associated E3 ubiquitin-protein ligase HRD1 [Babesia sp. Xinjiang]|uniref:ERAD-associated E3 ubiquitin-protein ligase HRD1 n=1 Tax=Babesia sp. Xinjiang TaxID=462227 RepID=UPI000A2459C3|nr:ERAD-associated E3 ubiquitin-protein ligase HRD1 [Babesia sp. Xinjiang]ORM39394.1 ERAD-associated E3 ubiquitin-protein ligase HRD1 [Babesia sp. Xinjiang]